MLSNAAVTKEPTNHCYKREIAARWQQLLIDWPKDPVVIGLYALREGLCQMIDDGLVDLEQAIDIFNREHARGVMERLMGDNEKREEKLL